LILSIQPNEGVDISFQTKRPEAGMQLEPRQLAFDFRDSYAGALVPDAYERLLLDALSGDAALFIRSDEIELCWRAVDPLIAGLQQRGREPLPSYGRGSHGPPAASHWLQQQGREWFEATGSSAE
jgi:glucose-6-phosphate 1-dehydrogenase